MLIIKQCEAKYASVCVCVCMCVCVCVCIPPLLSVSVGLLVRRQLDDENAGLSVLKALLVVGRLWRALGVQHKDLGPKEDTSSNSSAELALPVQQCGVVSRG